MARLADPNRREDILRAAREVFLTSGFSDARLSDIALKAGVVVSTLYLYFSSKEEMVQALAYDLHVEVAQAILPIIAAFQNIDDVHDFIRIVISFASANGDLLKLQLLDAGLQGLRAKRPQRPRGPFFQEIKFVLSQRMEQGYIRRYDPAILLEILIGFLRWIFEICAQIEEDELPQYEEMFVSWLANALLPPSIQKPIER